MDTEVGRIGWTKRLDAEFGRKGWMKEFGLRGWT